MPIHRNLEALGPGLISRRPSALALDVSKRAIGLAGADPTWTLPTPLPSIRRTRLKVDLEALGRTIREREVGLLVLGWPLEMDGREGPRCQSVMAFARDLDTAFGLPIVLQDERLTTFAAEQALEGRTGRRRRAPDLDSLAAAQILEDFLSAIRRPS
ncbi:MAG: Holliday junction resolvase RuvX [Geminicoccaceae bacterium]|nr:Holliday junction resolvase RuvX [Geminicoccaceae bacterium]